MKKVIKAFTIVELVVVIIILTILATLGFVTFSGYSSGVRDSNRIAQLTGISTSLSVYNIKNFLPLPDNYILLEVNGEDIGYQGYAGNDVLEEIDYKKGGKDPKDDKYYTYYVTKSRNKFQLMGFLGSDKSMGGVNLTNKTYGFSLDYTNRTPYLEGKRLGILLESVTNTPIQELESLIAVKKLDLGTTTDIYKAYLNNGDIIEGDNTVLSELKISALVGGKGCTGKSGVLVCDYDYSSIIEDITIVGDDASGRTWSGGTIAEYCNNYRNPSVGYSYSGDVGDGVYWIDPALNGTGFKVWCDMTSDGGGWTYVTLLRNSGPKNLFDTGNSTKIVSISGSQGSNKGRIDDIWLDSEDKDLMLICETTHGDTINYKTPFFVYGFQKADIGNLIKQNKEGTIFSSIGLTGKWDSNTFLLHVNYGESSVQESLYLNKSGFPGSNGFLFMLRGSYQMASYPDGAIEGPSYSSPQVNRSLNSNNYCMSAIR